MKWKKLVTAAAGCAAKLGGRRKVSTKWRWLAGVSVVLKGDSVSVVGCDPHHAVLFRKTLEEAERSDLAEACVARTRQGHPCAVIGGGEHTEGEVARVTSASVELFDLLEEAFSKGGGGVFAVDRRRLAAVLEAIQKACPAVLEDPWIEVVVCDEKLFLRLPQNGRVVQAGGVLCTVSAKNLHNVRQYG